MFTNIVLSGGGIRGMAYIGCYKYFVEKGIFKFFKNIIGSSVGSIFATLFCLDYSYDEVMAMTYKVLDTLKTKEYDPENILNVYSKLGVSEGNGIMGIINLLLFKKLGEKNVTFLDFAKKTGKNLIITGSNLSKSRIFLCRYPSKHASYRSSTYIHFHSNSLYSGYLQK